MNWKAYLVIGALALAFTLSISTPTMINMPSVITDPSQSPDYNMGYLLGGIVGFTLINSIPVIVIISGIKARNKQNKNAEQAKLA